MITGEKIRDSLSFIKKLDGKEIVELENAIDEALLKTERQKRDEMTPRKGTTLDTVTTWIKKFPRETLLTVVSSDTGLVITRTQPNK